MLLYESVIDTACRKATDFGYAAEIWTHAKMTNLLNRHLTPSFRVNNNHCEPTQLASECI
jgi:hypothetical protein